MRSPRYEIDKRQRERRETNIDAYVSNLVVKSRWRAKDKAMDFNIDNEYIKNLIAKQNGRCAESGVVLTYKTNCFNKASIDRINSDKGYTKRNVQIVTRQINMAKGELNTQEFRSMCSNVHKNSK